MDSINRIQNNSIYKGKRKKKKKPLTWKRLMKQRAASLNQELPRSEQWFQDKFKKDIAFQKYNTKFNVAFKNFIYDVYMKKLGLVIEVDGSIHREKEQLVRDEKKDKRTAMYGLKMIRVEAYNEESYKACIAEVMGCISSWESRRKPKIESKKSPKVILRKDKT
jgi:very-short-patch-repair endonuclease